VLSGGEPAHEQVDDVVTRERFDDPVRIEVGSCGSAVEFATAIGAVAAKFSDERSNLVRAVESASIAQHGHVVVGRCWQIAQGGPEAFRMLYDLDHVPHRTPTMTPTSRWITVVVLTGAALGSELTQR
jgi:hypothetical protein